MIRLNIKIHFLAFSAFFSKWTTGLHRIFSKNLIIQHDRKYYTKYYISSNYYTLWRLTNLFCKKKKSSKSSERAFSPRCSVQLACFQKNRDGKVQRENSNNVVAHQMLTGRKRNDRKNRAWSTTHRPWLVPTRIRIFARFEKVWKTWPNFKVGAVNYRNMCDAYFAIFVTLVGLNAKS